MKDIEIKVPLKEAEFGELTEMEQRLVTMAREATHRSYAPYSHFCVGAAILLDGGEIVTGSNQENVAYPSGTCAERSACFYAHAQYPESKFKEIVIAARGTDGEFVENPIAPCGACRQALLEYETLAGEDVKVILCGRDKFFILPSVKSLLPLAFVEF
ncbi:MAG: cytidine deaminase [Duncaniella sp.]|nr:cytidine deaminase [Duncaniella sp.]MDE6858879.1 cytidine deaminase [Duncaniella sp.]MDE7144920.1 cytidine deaminase [Duncaniella sp.]